MLAKADWADLGVAVRELESAAAVDWVGLHQMEMTAEMEVTGSPWARSMLSVR